MVSAPHRLVASVVLVLAVSASARVLMREQRKNITSGSADSGWIKCADEGGRCSFKGTMTVRFGLEPNFEEKVFSDGVDCSTTQFGDPVPGQKAVCMAHAGEAGCGESEVFGPSQTVKPCLRSSSEERNSQDLAGQMVNLVVFCDATTPAFKDPSAYMGELRSLARSEFNIKEDLSSYNKTGLCFRVWNSLSWMQKNEVRGICSDSSPMYDKDWRQMPSPCACAREAEKAAQQWKMVSGGGSGGNSKDSSFLEIYSQHLLECAKTRTHKAEKL